MPSPSLNRQLKSFTALAVDCELAKIGGSVAGTPPGAGSESSHTAEVPLPRGRDVRICKPGSFVGSTGLQSKVDRSIGTFVPPTRPSTTIEKPEPKKRWKIGTP